MMQTRIIAFVTLSLLVGCHADDSDSNADAAVDAQTVDAGDPKQDADAPSDAGMTPTTGPGGACVEGMQCDSINLSGGFCSDYAPCACVGGTWQCADSGPIMPLPTRDPKPGEGCIGTDFACTQPDVCGGLCSCFEGKWACGIVAGGGDAGPSCAVTACSVLPPADGLADGGCFPVSCSSIGQCVCHEH